MALPCPACGFLTVPDGTYGSFCICPVCEWEDDNVQLDSPAYQGGANGESLIEAQNHALSAHPLDEREFRGIQRDPLWRPLNEQEKVEAQRAESQDKAWKYVLTPSEAYWLHSR